VLGAIQFATVLALTTRSQGILFLVVLLSFASIWFAVVRRRQQWWWGFERRPGDNTGERWMRSNEARADKPMPERRVTVQGSRRRR